MLRSKDLILIRLQKLDISIIFTYQKCCDKGNCDIFHSWNKVQIMRERKTRKKTSDTYRLLFSHSLILYTVASSLYFSSDSSNLLRSLLGWNKTMSLKNKNSDKKHASVRQKVEKHKDGGIFFIPKLWCLLMLLTSWTHIYLAQLC